jgi:hypothetical protein
MEKITAALRVTDLNAKPFVCAVENGIARGQLVTVKASGYLPNSLQDVEGIRYCPISLHMVVRAEEGSVPAIGDNLSITVERRS